MIVLLEKRQTDKWDDYVLQLDDGTITVARSYVVAANNRERAQNKRTKKLLGRVTAELKEPPPRGPSTGATRRLERERLKESRERLQKRVAAENAQHDRLRKKGLL
jgi:hypothetical protein